MSVEKWPKCAKNKIKSKSKVFFVIFTKEEKKKRTLNRLVLKMNEIFLLRFTFNQFYITIASLFEHPWSRRGSTKVVPMIRQGSSLF